MHRNTQKVCKAECDSDYLHSKSHRNRDGFFRSGRSRLGA